MSILLCVLDHFFQYREDKEQEKKRVNFSVQNHKRKTDRNKNLVISDVFANRDKKYKKTL